MCVLVHKVHVSLCELWGACHTAGLALSQFHSVVCWCLVSEEEGESYHHPHTLLFKLLEALQPWRNIFVCLTNGELKNQFIKWMKSRYYIKHTYKTCIQPLQWDGIIQKLKWYYELSSTEDNDHSFTTSTYAFEYFINPALEPLYVAVYTVVFCACSHLWFVWRCTYWWMNR